MPRISGHVRKWGGTTAHVGQLNRDGANRAQNRITSSDSAVSIPHSSSSLFNSRLRIRAMHKMTVVVLCGVNRGHHKETKSGSSTERNKLDAATA